MTDGIIAAVVTDASVYTPGSGGVCGITVILDGVDDARYIYRQLSLITVAARTEVAAGDPVGLSGGEPGTPGVGDTTRPYLHLSVRANAQFVCPQPVLLGILRKTPIPPTTTPSIGCIIGQAPTNWGACIDHAFGGHDRPQLEFCGTQFGDIFPLFMHFGVELWVPAIGGPVDPTSGTHDLIVNLDGGMGKGERNRIKTRRPDCDEPPGRA